MTDTTNFTSRSGQWLLVVGVVVLVVGVAAVLALGVEYVTGDAARPLWLGAVTLAAPVGLSLVLGGSLQRSRHRARTLRPAERRRAGASATPAAHRHGAAGSSGARSAAPRSATGR